MHIRKIMVTVALAGGLLLATAVAPVAAQAVSSGDAVAGASGLGSQGAGAAEAALAHCTHLSPSGYDGRHINFPSLSPTSDKVDCILSYGDRNWGVVALQQWLHFCGAPQVEVDGIYGSVTRDAIIWTQAAHGLDVDGGYGPKTMRVLPRAQFNEANQFIGCVYP